MGLVRAIIFESNPKNCEIKSVSLSDFQVDPMDLMIAPPIDGSAIWSRMSFSNPRRTGCVTLTRRVSNVLLGVWTYTLIRGSDGGEGGSRENVIRTFALLRGAIGAIGAIGAVKFQ